MRYSIIRKIKLINGDVGYKEDLIENWNSHCMFAMKTHVLSSRIQRDRNPWIKYYVLLNISGETKYCKSRWAEL